MRNLLRHKRVTQLTFAVFSVVGFVLLFSGKPGTGVMGLAILLMFGLTGVGWWLGESSRGRRPPTIRHVTLASGASVAALVISVARTKELQAVLTLAGIGAGALLIAMNPESLGRRGGPLMQIIMLAVGVGLLLYLPIHVRRLRKGHSDIWLTTTGLHHRGFVVPWNAINGVGRYEIYGQPYLGLSLSSDVGAYSVSRAGAVETSMSGFGRSVWLGAFAISPDDLERLITDYWQHPEHRLAQGIGTTFRSVDSAAVRS